MKITALYDENGVILAAAEHTGRYDDPVPVASTPGTKVATFEVPTEAARSRLDEICLSHQVDVAAQRLVRAKVHPKSKS
ncbi:MAG: hypothetical protein ACJ8J7_06150 [Sulfurifustaceae bacterium]